MFLVVVLRLVILVGVALTFGVSGCAAGLRVGEGPGCVGMRRWLPGWPGLGVCRDVPLALDLPESRVCRNAPLASRLARIQSVSGCAAGLQAGQNRECVGMRRWLLG